ncbi:MAG: YbjN domain-containing protein [Nitrospira sp.]|nr:YbjN domain-containing protein [Nitrospira sp.]
MARQIFIGLLILAGATLVGAGAVEQPKAVPPRSQPMTIQMLQGLLKDVVQDLKGESGQWRFTYGEVDMAILTSVAHDRMRIIAPVGPEADVTDQQRQRMLAANFHSALDARYAMSNGMIYAAYLHPLSPLQRDEVFSALHQVAQLVKTFGTTYSSSGLSFGSPGPPPRSDQHKEPYY